MLGGTVRGKRTTLRIPVEADLAAHARWAADLRLQRGGPGATWGTAVATATWKERFAEQAKDRGSVLWSIDDSEGALIGSALVNFDGGATADTVGLRHFLIDPERWHTGLGWDAALALHRWIFDFMDLRLAYAILPADNAHAVRILDRLGHESFGLGHAVYYRDGAYADQAHRIMSKDTWNERWGASEREYEPLPAAAYL
ncbi:MAG: hypothetical protein NVS9B6_03050 [Candidatus Limnocylindrales bacterium]